MQKQILVLWVTGRSRSTAFERMMLERGDFYIFHEPYGRYYYFSEERKSQRAGDVIAKPEYSFAVIHENILKKASAQPVFIKEHAFHAEGAIKDTDLANFTNTFLLRHPKEVIPSLFDKMPDFTKEELGYEAMYKLFVRCEQITGKPPIVIDSEELVNHPALVIKEYCRQVEIPFMEEALTWQPQLPSQFVWWEDGSWLKDVAASRGFQVIKKDYPDIFDNQMLRQAYDESMYYYEQMISHKLSIG